ncbi:hypothetical protein QYE76_007071 [Lolium multiflorum]|uniref:Probable purine permease n=1 Tax=Lolium multiflorum TaxID=4521 RepID=A0AAD8RZG3_LOLMU|nr:hypothetical protein QYE76_007071 [Lolium multiflorum]
MEENSEVTSRCAEASKIISASTSTYRSKPGSFWALLVLSAGAMLTAFPASSLLSRLYYSGGGQSKWILSWSAVAGWPIPALLLLLLPPARRASPTGRRRQSCCLWYALQTSSRSRQPHDGAIDGERHRGHHRQRGDRGAGLGLDRYPGVTGKQYALGFVLDVAGSALHGLIFALSELAFVTHLAAAGNNDGGASSSGRIRGDADGAAVFSARGEEGRVRDGVGVVGGDIPAGSAGGDGSGVPGVDGAGRRAERGEGAGDERGGGDLVFHDPMSGFKIVSLVITVWGFGSYVVGHSAQPESVQSISKLQANHELILLMKEV